MNLQHKKLYAINSTLNYDMHFLELQAFKSPSVELRNERSHGGGREGKGGGRGFKNCYCLLKFYLINLGLKNTYNKMHREINDTILLKSDCSFF